ncbi:hypothetical protein B0J17DRAFT_625620 [Rhizoctonia solani]|nr:hypothetical protein B0J17DRAFT_625620 [Rhizoctonia solani]
MFFARLAVVALSFSAALAAPINVEPKVDDVVLPAGIPPMVPRTASIVDALAAVMDVAQVVQFDLGYFNLVGVPVDDAKVVQLAADLVKLEDCINRAKAAISGAQGTLTSVDVTNTLSALKQVGEKLQSVPSLKFFEILGAQLAPVKSSVYGLVSEVTGHGVDFHGLAWSIPALFALPALPL